MVADRGREGAGWASSRASQERHTYNLCMEVRTNKTEHDDRHDEHDTAVSSHDERLFLFVGGGGTASETARPTDPHRIAPNPEDMNQTCEESPTPQAPRERSEREKTGTRVNKVTQFSAVGVYTLWQERERTVWMPVRANCGNSALMTAILADAVKKTVPPCGISSAPADACGHSSRR